MKFTLTLTFIALSIYLINNNSADAASRKTRAVSLQKCPTNSTYDECFEYAKEESKKNDYCHRFIIGGQLIEWQSCGVVSCGSGMELAPEDLSKSYPECCAYCREAIDEDSTKYSTTTEDSITPQL